MREQYSTLLDSKYVYPKSELAKIGNNTFASTVDIRGQLKSLLKKDTVNQKLYNLGINAMASEIFRYNTPDTIKTK